MDIQYPATSFHTSDSFPHWKRTEEDSHATMHPVDVSARGHRESGRPYDTGFLQLTLLKTKDRVEIVTVCIHALAQQKVVAISNSSFRCALDSGLK